MTHHRATVLVVDDEPEMVTLLRDFLNDAFEVITATAGDEALELVDSSIDVVVLDRRMPGLSGDEIAQNLHAGEHSPRLIFLSAIDPAELTTPEHDDYLQKPISREELIDAIESVLE